MTQAMTESAAQATTESAAQPLTQLQSFLAGTAVFLAALGGVLPLVQIEADTTSVATFAEAPILGLLRALRSSPAPGFSPPTGRCFAHRGSTGC